jgi:tetratricopeptide (TPR) repeat protein
VADVDVRVGAGLGGLLAAFRARGGWSQEDLADRSGLSVRAIRDLERGRVRCPRRATIALLVDALELTQTERSAVVGTAREAPPVSVEVAGHLAVDAGASCSPATVGVAPGGDGARLTPVTAVLGVSMPFSWAAPAQLPAAVTAFTGRARELAVLDAVLLGRNHGFPQLAAVAAITGSAGVGKTALAVQWAHRVRGPFPDGQLFLDLRGHARLEPMRPIEALTAFLEALGVPGEKVPAGVEQAAGLYRTVLAERRVLVVLDNALRPEQVRPLLPAGPGCRVVVTSRDRLSGLVAREGAHPVHVDALTPAEAHLLLARMVGDERVEAEPEAAAELARLCAHLPLALRIAAAKLMSYPRPLADQVAEFAAGNPLSALDADGDEQAAVRAAFGLSYSALPADARRVFRLLGLAPGTDVTCQAAAALAQITVEEAATLLDRLVAAHLLQRRAGGRLAVHDLLRLYAAERCEHEDSQRERDAAKQRLLEWHLHTADAAARCLYPAHLRLPVPQVNAWPSGPAFAGRSQALEWLDAERGNLVALIRHGAQAGPRRLAWLLADTLRGYFWLRMCLADWLVAARAGLAAAQADADLRAQAAAQLSLGDVYQDRGEHACAAERYSAALALMRETGWREGQASVLNNLGILRSRAGRLQESRTCYSQALAIHYETGSVSGQAICLINLGQACHESGQLEHAAECEAQALALSREAGLGVSEAIALKGLGEVNHAQGRLGDALNLLTRALDRLRETGNRGAEADDLRVLAQTHADTGRLTQALDMARAALALAREVGDQRLESDALNTLGACQRRLGYHTEAAELHGQARHVARGAAIRYSEAVALIGLATAAQRPGAPETGLAHAHSALALTRELGYRCLEGRVLTTLAGLYLACGQPARAAEHARQALAVHRETGQRLHQAHTLLLLGNVRHAQEAEAALPYWREALTLFAGAGSPQADHVRNLLRQAQPRAWPGQLPTSSSPACQDLANGP